MWLEAEAEAATRAVAADAADRPAVLWEAPGASATMAAVAMVAGASVEASSEAMVVAVAASGAASTEAALRRPDAEAAGGQAGVARATARMALAAEAAEAASVGAASDSEAGDVVANGATMAVGGMGAAERAEAGWEVEGCIRRRAWG